MRALLAGRKRGHLIWLLLLFAVTAGTVRLLRYGSPGRFFGPSEAQRDTPVTETARMRAEPVLLFVASEVTNTVRAFEADSGRLIASIPVGQDPHNLAASPDGRWVAVSDRQSGHVSLIGTRALTESARLLVGRQPHDLAFSPGSDLLYVGQEQDPYVAVIEVRTRTMIKRLPVGIPQHDIALSPDGGFLWFTVNGTGHAPGERALRIVDLEKGRVVTGLATGGNPHDVIFSPDGREVWLTNSGVIGVPDPRVTVIDARQQRVLGQVRVGTYPFHAPKRFKDGNLVPPTAQTMWFSDQGQQAVQLVDLAERSVIASVAVGRQPFHVTMGPTERLYVANRLSDSVTVIDSKERRAVAVFPVPGPHGLAVVARPSLTGSDRPRK